MNDEQQTRGALLCGSVPLSSAEEVFRTAASLLGPWLRRIPDGETGDRARWVGWQSNLFEAHPAFEPEPRSEQADYGRSARHVQLRAGVDPATLVFDHTGYADAAKESYADFARLKDGGVVPGHARFMVAIPTPLAVVTSRVAEHSRQAVLPAYERALLAEVDELAATIPVGELAVQWDVAIELFRFLDGPERRPDAERREVISRLVDLGRRTPPAVELGYHLCYGDFGHRHHVEPTDAGVLVEVSNALAEGVDRDIDWIHMPVPRDRDDAAFFEPLADLRLASETELYLGLVHLTDGLEGTQRRIAAAHRVVPRFGVATECGMGRRPPGRGGDSESLEQLFRLHAEVANPVTT